MSAFLEALRGRVLLGDGAMGTELLAREEPALRQLVPSAFRPEVNLSARNLTRPNQVLDVHRGYREAGAELHKTNTFTANRLRLRAHGLEKKVREVNFAGCRLARDVAGKGAFVAGSVGPLSDLPASRRKKGAVYREQMEALAEGGCDLLLLETFTALDELRLAIETAKASTILPVVASMAFPEMGGAGEALRALEGTEADVIGVNCVVPLKAIAILERKGGGGARPLAAFPSPGHAPTVLAPGAFAEQAARLTEVGVRLLGGCCGTTPDHLRALAKRMGR